MHTGKERFKIADTSPLGCSIRTDENYPCYIPYDFTRINFNFTAKLLVKACETTGLLAKLGGSTDYLDAGESFFPMFVQREACYSHWLAGIEMNIEETLAYPLQRSNSYHEKSAMLAGYRNAFNRGLNYIETSVINAVVIKRIHKELSIGSSDDEGVQGFRTRQNWWGGKNLADAVFVSPPPYEMENAMKELERFIGRADEIPPILKAGLIYAQFGTIRPFMTANGRTARLLLIFYLFASQLLSTPVLSFSHCLWQKQKEYVRCWQSYYQGDYEQWLDFFLDRMSAAAMDALTLLTKIERIRREDTTQLASLTKTAARHGMDLLAQLFKSPVTNVTQVMKYLKVTRPAAHAIIQRLMQLGILHNRDGTIKYGKSYRYSRYLAVFQ